MEREDVWRQKGWTINRPPQRAHMARRLREKAQEKLQAEMIAKKTDKESPGRGDKKAAIKGEAIAPPENLWGRTRASR